MNARDEAVALVQESIDHDDCWRSICKTCDRIGAAQVGICDRNEPWANLRDAVQQYDDLIDHRIAPEAVVGDDDAKAGGWEYARDIAEQQVEEALNQLLRTDRKVA